MSKVINIAKLTLAFVVIAGGFSLIIGSLMGGGISRGYDEIKGINKDPRSIMVQAVLIETDPGQEAPMTLPPTGAALSDGSFRELVAEADRLRVSGEARVRTPALLVQHAETGRVTITLGEHAFDAVFSPSVIETKHGDVLRVAMQIQRTDEDTSATPREMTFSTAYTSAPGGMMVLDLAGIGEAGSRAVLALRTTLIDPTPRDAN